MVPFGGLLKDVHNVGTSRVLHGTLNGGMAIIEREKENTNIGMILIYRCRINKQNVQHMCKAADSKAAIYGSSCHCKSEKAGTDIQYIYDQYHYVQKL